jgi:hypothetical protein
MQTQLVVTWVKAIAGFVTRVLHNWTSETVCTGGDRGSTIVSLMIRVLARLDLWNGVLKQLVVTRVKSLLD